jgi:hypothetical protein
MQMKRWGIFFSQTTQENSGSQVIKKKYLRQFIKHIYWTIYVAMFIQEHCQPTYHCNNHYMLSIVMTIALLKPAGTMLLYGWSLMN